ncbi:MAG: TIGR02147 family protein [Myxococcales bacterium]|nr:TIGR02147 family protein [Myxococcales bacterium]
MDKLPDVFEYLDYRKFLADYYLARKAQHRGFSYRYFSKRAGIASPNYLKLIIESKRRLSVAMARRFAATCQMDEQRARYFTTLVQFNQANDSRQKHRHYEQLQAFHRYRTIHKLDHNQAMYHALWYAPAIFELAASPYFRSQPDWICKQLMPKITRAEAKHALDVLKELGLLAPDDCGRLKQAHPMLSTGPETSGVHIINFHRLMMQRASESIDAFPREQRDISSLTLCLDSTGLATIKQRIQDLRKELLELSLRQSVPQQVVQVNFQLFPLSHEVKKES